MYAGKGHSITLPRPMSIAKELPLLPSDVGIVILKRIGASGKSRHYSVKRQVVQDALEVLCYGYPLGGVDSPNELCNEVYTGPDHIHISIFNIFQTRIIMMSKYCMMTGSMFSLNKGIRCLQ